MSHSNNKRIIYESDDDTNEMQKVTKSQTISSEVKRIICESDDESIDIPENNHSVARTTSSSSRSHLKRKSSDDGDSDSPTEPCDATTQRTRSSLLNSSDDTPQILRRSQRSAVTIGNDKVPDALPDFNLRQTKAIQAESIDSLQSLSKSRTSSTAKFRKEKISKNDEDEFDDVDDDDEGEMPDSEGDSGASDDDADDESQGEKGGRKSGRHGRSSRTPSHAEKQPRSYVTTRSQCNSSASRTSSDRNQAILLAKEAKREVMLEKMRRRLSVGESALDALSSSEEEEEEEDRVEPSSASRKRDSKGIRSDSPISRQQSPQSNSGQQQRTKSRSQPSSRSSRPLSGSSAFIRKEVMPERYNSDEDEDDDCVDDFIVGSDEERDEQQRQMEEIAKERERRHKRKEKERRRREEEASMAIRKAEKERIKADKIELERMRQLHSETKNRRRKIIVEDDDEDENEEEGGGGAGAGGSTMTPIGPVKALSFATTVNSVSSSRGAVSSSSSSNSSSSSVTGSARSAQTGSRSVNRIEIELSSDEEEGTVTVIKDDDIEDESEEEHGCENENDSSEEEDEDDEEDDESLDGPMLYRRVDAMREELEDRDELNTSIMKVYSHPEALMLYVEMLAHAHADPSFVTHCADVSLRRAGATRTHASSNSSSSSSSGSASTASTMRIREYLAAARQIENLICTSRESLLGSSAWRPDFLAALKSRPFYFVTELPSSCYDERCQACNRTSQSVNRKVHLFGPHYDADRAWMKAEWDKELPSALFLNADAEDSRRKRDRGKKKVDVYLSDSSSGNDDEVKQSQSSNRNKGKGHERQVIDLQEDEDEEEEEVFVAWWQRKWRRQLVKEAESGWHLASHCRARTQMYHTLLHYKARLFLKIGDKLRACGSVSALIADSAYMCQEVDRFHALLKTAGDKWGGGKEMSEQAADLWLDSSAESLETSHRAKRPGEGRTTVLDFIVGRERPKE